MLKKGQQYKKPYPDSPDSNQDFVEFFAAANTTTAGPDNTTLVEVSEADVCACLTHTPSRRVPLSPLSLHSYVYLSTYLPIYLSIHPSIRLSDYLPYPKT